MYSRFLSLWMEHFPLGKRLLIVDGDNLALRPWEEATRVEKFLELPRYNTCQTDGSATQIFSTQEVFLHCKL